MESVLIIVVPTASGKTKLSIELAKDLNGEIISADSMQLYRFMDIGTAKPDKEEMSGIRHYLIDEVNPDVEFSVAKYQELALQYIQEVLEKGKLPIVVGGTGLYVNSLIYNINFSETIIDWEFREKLKKEAEEKGNEYLHNKLREIDQESAQKLHVNDIKRIIRAIEVYEYTKKPISYHQEISRQNPPSYNFIVIGLRMDRDKLYQRINQRVDLMMEKGLMQEVQSLIESGYDKNTVAMQGIGYKEMLAHLRGEISLEEAVDLIKVGSRHYAKRQITWFKRLENIFWIDVDEKTEAIDLVKIIHKHIASSGII